MTVAIGRAVGDVDDDRRRRRQALEEEDDGGSLGRLFGCAVVNGANSGGGQGLRRIAAGGGVFWDMKREYNIALSKATTAQTILRREGRPDIALHNAINLSHRTQ